MLQELDTYYRVSHGVGVADTCFTTRGSCFSLLDKIIVAAISISTIK